MTKIQILFKLSLIWFASWAIACFINIFKCIAVAGDSVGDCIVQTAIFSFAIIMPCFPILYLPIMFGLRRLLSGVEPKIVFLLISAFLYLLPLGWIYLFKSQTMTEWLIALFDPLGEFNVVFFVTGLTFGLGFVSLLSKSDFAKSTEKESLSLLP